ncbi:MAG: SAM-dependent DNA methyltransferase [Bacteroidales bacterium]|nr:SAM-dependent DNA methyltransferase [Bacteroidales bacterium]
MSKYDFSKLGFDIIGRIFERLIPAEERHNLGQYFTNADVVDLILKFCVHHEDDKVLDPSCGAGTFLVRAYHHLKLMNLQKPHEEILQKVWGNDIAKFPAHLSTINLAIKDLAVDKNYPNILKEDFFELKVSGKGFEIPSSYRKRLTASLGGTEREITYPRWFDAIVGNPPYTRQEEIPDIGVNKNKLIENALYDGNRQLAKIGKRAGIHAYFFVHSWKFLKEDKFLGFIISNSWLDVDYGKGLQEFFLKHFKIVAIIESKVERWFTDADVNTCIVILQKCDRQKQRDENPVRFTYLKKPFRHFIPATSDDWDKQVERLEKISDFRKTILAHSELYENEDFRVFPILQKDLLEEGVDEESGKYAGAKWGKYLRAPEIFFKILEKGKGKLVPLKEVATVKFGIKTGANDFFYLTEEQIKAKGIEKEFWMQKEKDGGWVPNYILKSFKQTKSISINKDDLLWKILYIKKDKKKIKSKKVFKYILQGEIRQFGKLIPAKSVTCSSRGENWFNLGNNYKAHIFYPRRIGDRFLIPYSEIPIYSSDNLFPVFLKDPKNITLYSAFFNSTVVALFNELYGRTLTGAINVIDMDVWMVYKIPVLDFSVISSNFKNQITQIFSELSERKIENTLVEILNRKDVLTFNSVCNDRRKLDQIVMGDILGLTDEEQLEVYKAVVDLVKSRIEKAGSVTKQKKIKEGIDVEAFVENLLEKTGEENIGKYYRENILSLKNLKKVSLPKVNQNPEETEDFFGWKLVYGKNKYIECASEAEARYLKIFAETGIEEVLVPTQEKELARSLQEIQPIKEENDKVIKEYLGSIVNKKTAEDLRQRVWRRILE